MLSCAGSGNKIKNEVRDERGGILKSETPDANFQRTAIPARASRATKPRKEVFLLRVTLAGTEMFSGRYWSA